MICQCNGWQVWDQCQQTPLLQSRCSDVWGLKGRLRAFISRLYEALEQSGARCVLRLSLKRWTQMRINHMKGMFCYVLSTLNLGVRVEWVVLSDALFCKHRDYSLFVNQAYGIYINLPCDSFLHTNSDFWQMTFHCYTKCRTIPLLHWILWMGGNQTFDLPIMLLKSQI